MSFFLVKKTPILMFVSLQGFAEPGALVVWDHMSLLQCSVDLAGIVWNKASRSLFLKLHEGNKSLYPSHQNNLSSQYGRSHTSYPVKYFAKETWPGQGCP